jgi:hypothetical protein
MAAFDFPSSPTVGQTYTPAGGPTYAWNGVSWNVVATNVSGGFSQQTFTATLGQTVFTVSPGYQPGLIDVFQNGVKLVLGSDYTATSGTTIVLSAPAALGDTIQTICYAAISAANSYTKAEVDALLKGHSFSANALPGTPIAGGASVATLIYNQNEIDPNGLYDATNGQFRPTIAGWYAISASATLNTGASGRITLFLHKNGAEIHRSSDTSSTAAYGTSVSGVVPMNGTSDILTIGALSGGAVTLDGPTSNLIGALVRRA